MKKIVLLLLSAICTSFWAEAKMCADTTVIGGGNGLLSPNPNQCVVSYYIDPDAGIINISTTETCPVRVQIIGQQAGIVADEQFIGSNSIVLYYTDLYEIRFILYSGRCILITFTYNFSST